MLIRGWEFICIAKHRVTHLNISASSVAFVKGWVLMLIAGDYKRYWRLKSVPYAQEVLQTENKHFK